jgi:hypothetical protein
VILQNAELLPLLLHFFIQHKNACHLNFQHDFVTFPLELGFVGLLLNQSDEILSLLDYLQPLAVVLQGNVKPSYAAEYLSSLALGLHERALLSKVQIFNLFSINGRALIFADHDAREFLATSRLMLHH